MGEYFLLSETGTAEGSVDIRLVEVLRQRGRPCHRQPFAVHFQGPASPVFYQALYRLSHPEMGEMECLVGPVMSDGPGVTYEAVFS
jgi:hypothetical protein